MYQNPLCSVADVCIHFDCISTRYNCNCSMSSCCVYIRRLSLYICLCGCALYLDRTPKQNHAHTNQKTHDHTRFTEIFHQLFAIPLPTSSLFSSRVTMVNENLGGKLGDCDKITRTETKACPFYLFFPPCFNFCSPHGR